MEAALEAAMAAAMAAAEAAAAADEEESEAEAEVEAAAEAAASQPAAEPILDPELEALWRVYDLAGGEKQAESAEGAAKVQAAFRGRKDRQATRELKRQATESAQRVALAGLRTAEKLARSCPFGASHGLSQLPAVAVWSLSQCRSQCPQCLATVAAASPRTQPPLMVILPPPFVTAGAGPLPRPCLARGRQG